MRRVLLLVLLLAITGCTARSGPGGAKGMAILHGVGLAARSGLDGSITLTDTTQGLHVVAFVKNAPLGQHGFHIHEHGSCDDGGNAAGGHFNPAGVQHGYVPRDGVQRAHVGDLGNMTITGHGTGYLDVTLPGVTLRGRNGVLGRAMILHAGPDDLKSQPTGAAGARIGCGIIRPRT